MPVKLRLQRHGRKRKPFYHIVAADSRAPRDGRFIEKVGTFNPIDNPSTVVLDVDRALYWLQNGAQPTDKVKSILSAEGVLYRNHLNGGVKKGAMTQEQADAKFEAWMKEKERKVGHALDSMRKAKEAETNAKLAAEKEVAEKRSAAIAAAAATAETAAQPAEEAAEEAAPAEEAAENSAPAEETAAE